MTTKESPSFAMPWKLIPWLVGLAASPILFGCVNSQQQAMVGVLFASSLFLIASQNGSRLQVRSLVFWLSVLIVVFFPLVPLPVGFVEIISPERVALAKAFPVQTGEPIVSLPLTLSPAATLQRVFEIFLLVACYFLARFAGRFRIHHIFGPIFSLALIVLVASDIWYRIWGNRKLLGIWPDSAGHAAGTFANRNHFADWIYVCSFLLLGWIFHRLASITKENSGKSDPSPKPFEIYFAGAALLLAIPTAVLTGSRGGLIAFVIGFFTWLLLTKRTLRRSRQKLMVIGVVIVILLLLILASAYVLSRLDPAYGGMQFKIAIWHDAFDIIRKFPLFGTGWGTFEAAFSHYKTANGEMSFLHAENDYVQLFVENGILLATLLLFLLGNSLRHILVFIWHRNKQNSALLIGCFSGLMVFLSHGLVEFVFQISATAMLAAAIFGYLSGVRERAAAPQNPPSLPWAKIILNSLLALGLLTVSALQLRAWQHWRMALQTSSRRIAVDEMEKSLRLWPAYSSRSLDFIRVAQKRIGAEPVEVQPEMAVEYSKKLAELIALDPFNWRLRYESLPLRIAPVAETREEAWRIVHLNPTPPKLPLYFAQNLVGQDMETKMEFFRRAAEFPENLNAVYWSSWNLGVGAGFLWSITPNTDEAMQKLGEFALSRNLPSMAATAFARISPKVKALERAENFLSANRPDLALETASGKTQKDNYLRSRAYYQLGNYLESTHCAELVWRNTSVEREIFRKDFSIQAPRKEELLEPEKMLANQAKERDLQRLRKLAGEHPKNLRITWILFETERDLFLADAAAQTALKLAKAVLEREAP